MTSALFLKGNIENDDNLCNRERNQVTNCCEARLEAGEVYLKAKIKNVSNIDNQR